MLGLQWFLKMPETFLNMPIYAGICLIYLNTLEFLKCLETFTNTLTPESAMESSYEYVTRICFTLILSKSLPKTNLL